MSRQSLIGTVTRVLACARIAPTRTRVERIEYLSPSGWRGAGWRILADLPVLTAEERGRVHKCALDSLGVRYHYDPALGDRGWLSLEGI